MRHRFRCSQQLHQQKYDKLSRMHTSGHYIQKYTFVLQNGIHNWILRFSNNIASTAYQSIPCTYLGDHYNVSKFSHRDRSAWMSVRVLGEFFSHQLWSLSCFNLAFQYCTCMRIYLFKDLQIQVWGTIRSDSLSSWNHYYLEVRGDRTHIPWLIW